LVEVPGSFLVGDAFVKVTLPQAVDAMDLPGQGIVRVQFESTPQFFFRVRVVHFLDIDRTHSQMRAG